MDEAEAYIDVAVAVPVYQTFSYTVPAPLAAFAAIGKRVLVPFGHRRVTGYIMEMMQQPGVDKAKHVFDILDDTPLFPPSMVKFFRWIADYYKYPLGLVVQSALPGGLSYTERSLLSITDEGKTRLSHGILTPVEKHILNALLREELSLQQIEKKTGAVVPKTVINRMVQEKWLSRKQKLRKDRIRPKMERFVSLVEPEVSNASRSEARKKIIDLLRLNKELSVRHIRKKIPNAARLIKAMADAGIIRIHQRRLFRDPFGEPVPIKPSPELTREQKDVIDTVTARLKTAYHTFLLAGVTGSGKTEVYLQLATAALDRGLSVLVLVPEIALITQLERRFRSRFGDRIAMLHSGLSRGERYDQWQKINQRKVRIAVGARSAIFAPFDDLGLIIVDEEHDGSYKQENTLRYHARDLAVVRAKLLDATAVLGSATPSIQSYHNAVVRKYTLLELTQRVEQRNLPEIEIVDLSRLREARGAKRFISDELYSALEATLGRGEQAILFLNRRGFANFAVCPSCNRPIQCKHCDISLTYHQQRNAYQCHYCGFSMAASSPCPSCGSKKIMRLGFGTEKIEALFASLFPEKRISRMDRDSIRHKGALLKILKGLKNQTTDILIGTQMVAKGHDFPNITLVGILCADLSLNFPDFRAGEQTFQLLAQVSGRAGRGNRPGRVILQTYSPDNFAITCARKQDFKSFYTQEIVYRKSLEYPPFSRMVQILVSSKNKALGLKQIKTIEELCRTLQSSDPKLKTHVTVMGPVEAPLSKIASYYRRQILLKGKSATALHTMLHRLLTDNPALLNSPRVKTTIDVDPVFMM